MTVLHWALVVGEAGTFLALSVYVIRTCIRIIERVMEIDE